MVYKINDIVELVEKEYDIAPGSIKGPNRSKTITEARSVASYLCRRFTSFSYPEIAERLNKHHSVVMDGVKRTRRALNASME